MVTPSHSSTHSAHESLVSIHITDTVMIRLVNPELRHNDEKMECGGYSGLNSDRNGLLS